MNRRIVTRIAATGIAAASVGLGLFGVPGTAAQDVVPGIIDVTVDSITSKPTVVSPPGAGMVIEVVVGEHGILPAAGTLTVDLPGDAGYIDGATDAGSSAPCAETSPTIVTCDFSDQGGTFRIVATSPTTAGTYTTTASVTSPGEPLEYTANNSKSVDTTVTDSAPGSTKRLLLRNQSTTVTANDGTGRTLTLTVPNESPGVIVSIDLRDGTGHTCGVTYGCAKGFLVKFDTEDPYFQARDPQHPLVSVTSFGSQAPCLGIGGNCTEMYWAPDESSVNLTKMGFCPGAGGSSAGSGTLPYGEGPLYAPCINRKYKGGGTNQTTFDWRLLSVDPLITPPQIGALG